MNPFDALLVPPAMLKRALDDVHDIAEFARRYERLEADVRERVEHMEGQFDALLFEIRGLREQMAPMQNLEPIRRGIEPLEESMVAVRESVDELEPMIADLDQKIRKIDPMLDEMAESIEPIGDLAEKIPGNRKRR